MENRLKELYTLIQKYDRAYYGLNESIISDQEYDKLYSELLNLEKKYPHLILPDSPTQRVGNDLNRDFKKVEHSYPMMSIDNTYSHEELRNWIRRTKNNLGTDSVQFIGELKVDGVACAIKYQNGVLQQAITRGNGLIGDDITINVKTIKSIPLKIEFALPLEIRGEIYLTFKNFNKLNTRYIENGQKPLQNPRNTASGTVKLLDPSEVAQRKLSFSAHYLISERHTDNHMKNLGFIKRNGIPTVIHSNPLNSLEEVIQFCETWKVKKNDLPFPSDGIVVKVNNIQYQKMLGETAKSPRWLVAYKFKPETAVTEVISIDPQVGRTGIITPVARLKAVSLSGSTVKNATLHNYDEIKRLNVTTGDRVEIEKSGEIIPKIIRVVSKQGDLTNNSYHPPEKCPSCKSYLVKLKGEVALRCINTSCPAQIFASLTHFVSREAMNIEGLGISLLEQLIKKKIVASPSDIFNLKEDVLENLERMGSKSASNLVQAIQKAKKNPLSALIHGLGIRMVGAQSAKILSKSIESLFDLKTMTVEELTSIDSIGPQMAESIVNYFSQKKNIEMVKKLQNSGVNLKGEKREAGGSILPLEGQTYVITGVLKTFSRQSARNELEKRGAKVTGTVSKKTSKVIVGENPGSKLARANKLGIEIIDEGQFVKLLKRESY
jgi:DNA ligase (NAD+)